MVNFLGDYLLYNSGNEAHEHYHFWCGLVAMSSFVSRKVWVDQGYFQIYPNLYVCLLGPPGFGKNTALNACKDLIREVGDVNFSAECQTKEALVKELAHSEVAFDRGDEPPLVYTPISILVTEFSQFVGIDPHRMLDFLVTIYDAKAYDMKTKKEGHEALPGPFVTLLGCTTPSWVTRYLKEEVITGGFNRRCIFVLEQNTGKRIAFPKITEEMQAARNRCLERAQWLKNFAVGPFTWTPKAKEYYKCWYEGRVISMEDETRDFDKTKSDLVLKVAMLLSLSKRDDLVLNVEAIQTAQAALDKIQARLPEVYRGMGRNELAQVSAKLEAHLIRSGAPVPRAEMKALLWRDATGQEFIAVLNHMASIGRLLQFERDGKAWLALPEWTKQ